MINASQSFRHTGCRWNVAVLGEKPSNGCISSVPLFSRFSFVTSGAPSRCSSLRADSCVNSVSGWSVIGDQGVAVRRFRGHEGRDGGLAAEGELGQRHGLMRETLRSQDGEGMTWRTNTK